MGDNPEKEFIQELLNLPGVKVIHLDPDPVNVPQDTTETARRREVARINSMDEGREELEKQYGQVWNTDELRQDFNVEGFMAPCVVVRRRSDGKRGTLTFQHDPRLYWGFMPEENR